MTLKVETLLMGDVEINEEDILFFTRGLPGFPEYHRWVLAGEDGETIRWLLSVDCGHVALPVTSPEMIDPGYSPAIPADVLEDFDFADTTALTRLAVLNLPKETPWRGTANLLAPILLNPASRKGRQIVLTDDRYSVHTPLLPEEKILEIEAARAEELQAKQGSQENPESCSS